VHCSNGQPEPNHPANHQEDTKVPITVRLGAQKVTIDAPEGMTLNELIVEVSQEYPVAPNVTATLDKTALNPDDVIPDNSRVILTQPAGEKG